MSDRYEVHATNDVTAIRIASKYTLAGALNLACDLLDEWDDIHIRHYEEGSDVFKIVAKLSNKGLLF